MISTEENKASNEDTNLGEITLFSIKNNCFYNCKTEEFKRFMTLCEMDAGINKYKPFDFTLVINNAGEFQIYQGFEAEYQNKITYIVVCDYLLENKKYADYIVQQMQQKHTLPVELYSCPTNGFCNRDVVTDNAVFLYDFALLPLEREAFELIQEITTDISEISIGKLKKAVKNDTAVYQLLFHHALCADIENEAVSDNMMVDASPIINSIIGNLTEAQGGAINTGFDNTTTGSNSLESFKSGETVKYQTEFEREFLLDIEFDSTVLGYERLGSLAYSGGQWKPLPFLPSYLILRDGYQPEIITLDHEENTAGQKSRIIKQHIENFAEDNGLNHKFVTKKDIHQGNLITNLEILYKDVNSPFVEDDVLILREVFQAVDSMSLDALRMLVINESVVNTLLFHKALSADLCGEVLSDSTRISKGLSFDDYLRWVEQVSISHSIIKS